MSFQCQKKKERGRARRARDRSEGRSRRNPEGVLAGAVRKDVEDSARLAEAQDQASGPGRSAAEQPAAGRGGGARRPDRRGELPSGVAVLPARRVQGAGRARRKVARQGGRLRSGAVNQAVRACLAMFAAFPGTGTTALMSTGPMAYSVGPRRSFESIISSHIIFLPV
jgi:hypothetical protein